MPRFTTHETDETGYTRTLAVGKDSILTKWGVEFSDGDSFFIHGQKTNSTHAIVSLQKTKSRNRVVIQVNLATAPILVEIIENFSPTKITRKCYFTPQKDVLLTDISISQAFRRDAFHTFSIKGNEIPFVPAERNHQYETEHAKLVGNSHTLFFDFKSSFGDVGFVPVIYGRMSPEKGWVVHSRLFPKKVIQKVIVWCNKHWNKRIPFSDVLTKIGPLVNHLWYVGEKPSLTHRRTFGLSSFGLVHIPKNTRVEMIQTITLRRGAKKE